MSKLKVGDRVRVQESAIYKGLKIGAGVVREVRGAGLLVEHGETGKKYLWPAAHLELSK